jgi:hypothetical protein
VPFAAELGYDSTFVKDVTADYSDGEMRAALEVNLPNYANANVPTSEMVGAISLLIPPRKEAVTNPKRVAASDIHRCLFS